MSVFTDAEVSYLQNQRLGRLATAGADGQPHVVPVGFRYNAKEDAIEIGGRSGFAKRKRYQDVLHNPRVGFVVDDVASVSPWSVRGIEIRGQVEVLTKYFRNEQGRYFPGITIESFRNQMMDRVKCRRSGITAASLAVCGAEFPAAIEPLFGTGTSLMGIGNGLRTTTQTAVNYAAAECPPPGRGFA